MTETADRRAGRRGVRLRSGVTRVASQGLRRDRDGSGLEPDRFLMHYVRTADRMQRTASWIEAIKGGLDHLRAVVVDDSLGVCAQLDDAMARHVASYADGWRGALDPEQARFTSFVNAPGTLDPTISFRPERGQRLPGVVSR